MRWLLAIALMSLAGCQTKGVVPISKRGVGGFDKPGTSHMHGRGQGREQKPDLYVGNKSIVIESKEPDNTTGSLFVLDDQRNYLYATKAPFAIGQYVDVKVVPVQTKKEADQPADNKPAEPAGDQVVKELLEALPQLDPGPDGDKLITNLKMKIAHVYENGDALAVLKRNTKNPNEAREIAVRARIPYAALISEDSISTAQLADVHWADTLDGELTERYSSGWEDEYSLRLSGFTEAKSIYARQLEDKRKQTAAVQEQVKNQLISIGKERAKLADERRKWFEEKSNAEEKVQELEGRLEEQKVQIEEQNEQIKELQPQPESPGELRDGANGA